MVEKEYPEINGERLREIRMSRGLTVGRLGQAIGVSFERINELELGGGGAEDSTIQKLAEALDVEPAELLVEDA
jgi:transcriptional regulator with XRE-family HTH domain